MVPPPNSQLGEAAHRAEDLRNALLGRFSQERRHALLTHLRAMESEMDGSFGSRGYSQVTPAVRAAWNSAATLMQPKMGPVWAASLLADLMAQAPQRLSRFPTPTSILPHTAAEFFRILDHLEQAPQASRGLDDDVFLKDLGLCRLDTFPCVAQIVEKNAGISRRIAARGFFRAFGPLGALGLRTRFHFKPLFQIHTHTPMLRGFTPEGWDLCYLLVADLLQTYPNYQGLVGGSWYYDPELDRVSPRLSYLRQRPLSGGAILLPLGQSPDDVALATTKSETRRKLYQAGKYSPMGWLMVWPREPLIEWARANRQDILRNRPVSG